MNRPREGSAVVLLYVVPLLATAGFLASVGLGLLAVALLVIEAVVVTAVFLAKRRPAREARPRDGSTVVLLLGAGLVVVLGLLLLAAR